MNEQTPTPDRIMEVALGFMASKTFLSAIELGVFTELAKGPADLETLRGKFQLHPRSAANFFDALVAMKFISRENGKYSNTPETDLFLDRNKPDYIGGLLEMANARLYNFWGSLTEGLRTGKPQNEAKTGGSLFEQLYADPERLKSFAKAMTGISKHSARALAKKFDWQRYKTFLDVGAAEGAVPVELALAHPHLTGAGLDLPKVGPHFERYVQEYKLAGRLTFKTCDFFKENLPSADVIIMGHILHDWGLADKKMLLRKAYDALPKGGAMIVYECLIDDDRRQNVPGFLMSLNMLIETTDGFDYSSKDLQSWMSEIGFSQFRTEHLSAGDWMVSGVK